MGEKKLKGVVISSKDYKEKDKLITIFSLEEGIVMASMKGVRGEKAKLKFAKEIFCFGEFVLENTKGLNVVTQVEIIDNFFGLTNDISKYYEASAIIDIVAKTSCEQANPPLFISLLKSLKALCYQSVEKKYVLCKFLIDAFQNLGYKFVTGKCASCGAILFDKKYFNLNFGEIVCPACRNDFCVAISESGYSALKLLNATEYDKLQTLKLCKGSEVEVLKLLEKNFEWRFGGRFLSIEI